MVAGETINKMKEIKVMLWAIVLTALLLVFSWAEATVLYYHVDFTWYKYIACAQFLVGVLLFLWGIDLKKRGTIVIAIGVGLSVSTLIVASAIAQAQLQGL